MADYICVVTKTSGSTTYLVTVSGGACPYVLLTSTRYNDMVRADSEFMSWFQFDASQAFIGFSVCLVLWALGMKLGAVARILFSVRR